MKGGKHDDDRHNWQIECQRQTTLTPTLTLTLSLTLTCMGGRKSALGMW